MTEFFFYQVSDGLVVQVGIVPDHAIPLQIAPAGCAIAPGRAEIGDRYISGDLVNS